MIEHFRTRFSEAGSIVDFAVGTLRQQRMQALRAGQAWPAFELGDPAVPLDVGLEAVVNAANLGGVAQWRGRWIARCPAAGCSGAEYVDLKVPVFMCCSCWNVAYGHEWLAVALPSAPIRQQIEIELEQRPGRNQHWLPGETVAKLRRENRQHGIRKAC